MQQFANDLLPLALLFAVSVTGIFLTISSAFLRGFNYVFLSQLHAVTVIFTLLYLPFLWHDAYMATNFDGRFGLGIGTLVITTNALALTLYSFSCHSARHLIGGKHDCFSCLVSGGPEPPASFHLWKGVTKLNKNHELWAWVSFFVVAFTDFYVRMLAMGVWTDPRIIF